MDEGKTLNYKSFLGTSHTGAAVEAKIFEDLESAIGNKNVLATIEDGQGRLSVQCEGLNTNTVYTVLTNRNAKQIGHKFEPAYKPSANPSIPIPLSVNKLDPDFANTKYLYPVVGAEKNIVKIKMTGNRTSDFVKSNQPADFVNSAITPSKIVNVVEVKYTLHHLDDFDPVTGECTMQLVETPAHSTISMTHTGAGRPTPEIHLPAHSTISMTHTGSVGQYKAFNGSGY